MGGKGSKGAASKGSSQAKDNSESVNVFACDVAVSLAAEDLKPALRLVNALRVQGLSVYLDESAQFRRNGKAIVDSKVCMVILSSSASRQRGIKDDLSLAYITSKPLFPVYFGDASTIVANLPAEIKLMVEPLSHWQFDPKSKLDQVQELAKAIKVRAGQIQVATAVAEELEAGEVRHELVGDFWERHFKGQSTMEWTAFEATFKKDFAKDLAKLFPGQATQHLLHQLKHSLFQDAGKIDVARYKLWYKRYDLMMTLPFWNVVQLMAKQDNAIREVFDVESTVRLDAIQNLTKFQTPPVIDALRKLLKDQDANVRAVAAASLGRVRRVSSEDSAEMHEALRKAEDALVETLSDRDRLVRESTCLSLANLKSQKGIPGIVHLWRNDAISTVRAAALLSLEHIGGPEAAEAMHLTKVLTSEIQALQDAMRK